MGLSEALKKAKNNSPSPSADDRQKAGAEAAIFEAHSEY